MWSDDELTVLFAIFVSQPFSAGDDESEINNRIAQTLDRSPGAVDLQWRNIKHYLYHLELHGLERHVGENVKEVVDSYRTDLATLRSDALAVMEDQEWDLDDLLQR